MDAYAFEIFALLLIAFAVIMAFLVRYSDRKRVPK